LVVNPISIWIQDWVEGFFTVARCGTAVKIVIALAEVCALLVPYVLVDACVYDAMEL